ncbi:MAG: hypothetical protein EA379_12075 [Phycisphaerales bacterium]|nr:MAG: hypothetical protein EA379_12075 [Phycisphaerales bacterium]
MTPVDPRELSPRSAGDHALMGELILDERPCPGCGYELRGLREFAPCPECGRIISLAMQGHDGATKKPSLVVEQLVDAPVGYIRVTQAGFVAMILATVMTFVVGVSLFASAFGFGGLSNAAPMLLIASLLWLGGLALVMRPRPLLPDAPRTIETEWWMLRLVTLLTQSAFVLAAAVGALAPGGPSAMGGALLLLALALALIGAIGWIPTTVLLARYADWTADTDLGWRLRYAAMGMGVTAPLIAVMEFAAPRSWDVFMFYRLFTIFIFMLLLTSLGVFLWSSVSLAATCALAAGIARTRRSKDQRLVDRMRAEAEAHMRRVAQEPEMRTPDPYHPIGTPRSPGASSLGKSGAPPKGPPR